MTQIHKTTKETIACMGDTPSTGHPCIYIKLEPGKKTPCPYCGKIFLRTGKPY